MAEDDGQKVYPVLDRVRDGAHIASEAAYDEMYKRSMDDTNAFWKEQGEAQVDWFRPFDTVMHGEFKKGNVGFYLGGKINASYNCVDRHVKNGRADKTAILWEGDDAGDGVTVRHITFSELLDDVCRCANMLRRNGVRKGTPVCIYMPMVPEAAITMLACARIGAPHSVVFAGFSAEALRDRLRDGNCSILVTADQGLRGAKRINLKQIADKALAECPDVATCIVYKRTGADVPMNVRDPETGVGRDVVWQDAMALERPYCPCEWMDSEDPLFMLFTSGSTGKPKGIQHSTGGYLVYTSLTHKYVFDVREDDVYACVADVGWITGHSYIVYGPLCNGTTTVMFESTPMFPDAGRYWDMVQRHKINIFYTAPTAIRALMKYGEEPVKKYDRSSLRVLASVGEPINPEAWRWYYNVVGEGRCSISDTFWQTETGGVVLTPLPGATPMKPGSACRPFFGIEPVLLDAVSGEVQPFKKGESQDGVLAIGRPWPSMARTIYGNHARFLNTYMTAYPGYYFTGDGCTVDEDNYVWITGRVDDVINVSGHRIGSAEVESALVTHASIAEAAVVGVPHEVKGQALFAYCIPVVGVEHSPELAKELQVLVGSVIGGFARPDVVLVTPAVPKTRSGKIMRRILRKIACKEHESLGDISTLADPTVVETLIKNVADVTAKPK